MKAAFVLFFTFFIGLHPKAQIVEKENLSYSGSKYDVLVIKADSITSKRFEVFENTQLKSESELYDSLSKKGLFFLISAGSVDSNCNLLGLYISDRQKKADINLQDGSGNFFLKPNGFIGFSEKEVVIKNATDFSVNDDYTTAIQNGPMLISNNTINGNFKKASPNRNKRTGVGIFSKNGENYLVFATSLMPVNFYQFASFFADKYACTDALTLEGGVNCSFHLPSGKKSGDKSKHVCKYLYYPLQ